MKLKCFIATRATQGRRNSDFSFCEDGELVMFGSECDRDRCNVDGRCGCRRSLVGMLSHKGTTTFQVVEKEMTREDFAHLQSGALQEMGFSKGAFSADAETLLEAAANFRAGAIVEKRGDQMRERL